MAVKLFVTDLDGTLLPTGTKVSDRNIQAVRDAAAAGITVTIATGRMYRAALPVAEAIGVNVPIITYNGALIRTVEGETLHSISLEPELVREAADFFEERNWYLQGYSNDTLYMPVYNECSEYYETAQKVKGHVVGWDGLREHRDRVSKMLCISADAAETQARLVECRNYFKGRLDVVSSNPRYLELTPPGVSKASAMEFLAERMGITRAEIMAIGDSGNDLPMLKAAGKSVAMENALPEVKAACDYTTGSCEDDGFAEAIYRYALK